MISYNPRNYRPPLGVFPWVSLEMINAKGIFSTSFALFTKSCECDFHAASGSWNDGQHVPNVPHRGKGPDLNPSPQVLHLFGNWCFSKWWHRVNSISPFWKSYPVSDTDIQPLKVLSSCKKAVIMTQFTHVKIMNRQTKVEKHPKSTQCSQRNVQRIQTM
jgi:hypothetical protein